MIYIFKLFLNSIYFPIKLFKQKKKITFISRQSNKISLEFQMIIDNMKKENLTIKTINKKLEKNLKSLIENFFLLFLQMYHISTSKIVFVDGYSIPICMLKHKKNLKIIQLWHANGIIKKIGLQTLDNYDENKKRFYENMNMHKNYNYVISSSKETTKVFLKAFDISKENILEYGTPMLDYLYKKENELKKEEIMEKLSITKKVILYLPTIRKNNEFDFSKLINDFEKSNLNDYQLIIKGHPISNSLKKEENYKISKKILTEDLISISDYVISDYSNIIFEAGLCNKKVYIYAPDFENYKKKPGLNINIEKEFKNYFYKNSKILFDDIRANKKYDQKYLQKFIKKYIENFDGKATDRICDFITKNI